MGVIVQKFGGTSVGDAEKILNVANRVIAAVENGNQVVVVVSAMGKTTDSLVNLANSVSGKPDPREMDVLLTTGEQITISLLSMALQQKGYGAVSLTGWQAGIQTERVFGNARITDIDPEKIQSYLNEGKIAVVAGFQGITECGQISTLGRGGSDTTAVALAASLNAEKCEIHTDVDGVYTTDPRFIESARKLSSISYDEMLEMANLGAGVLHPRAVEFAKNYNVTLEVRSSFSLDTGTLVEEEVSMEKNLIVRGLAFESNVTKLTVSGLPNELTTLSTLFTTLASNGVNVDIIIQSTNQQNTTDISFSVETSSLDKTLAVLNENQSVLQFENLYHESGLAKVSIIGSGMISNPGVAAQMFQVMAENGVTVKMVSTSEIKVSTVVEEENMIKAIEALHQAFELDQRVPVHGA
ncbi:aspartate kinase [Pseudalkalibacillus caeni]|uniref:Aspartokinase n=1 Tax=Exobacillus caeni TaxID=2574798 RepID=A0A5R9F819_9BACL|nr:aspartate kinase [Pseudalkalibacillus caeni]TLS39191.1 aspartate kinase [Pseudalkalibacillus caeni]